MKDAITNYIDNHKVIYTLVAEIDGNVIAKRTSEISADDAAGYATTIDELVEKHIIDELASEAEYRAESAAENQMEDERRN